MDMEKMVKIGQQIEKFYADDRYTDIDANVWLGRGDERWYVEGKELEEDPAYWLTNREMMKKMCNELSGDEQFRRDEAVRREAQYEYAVQNTYITYPQRTEIVNNIWSTKENAEMLLDRRQKAAFGVVDLKLVKRRKAGPIEDA